MRRPVTPLLACGSCILNNQTTQPITNGLAVRRSPVLLDRPYVLTIHTAGAIRWNGAHYIIGPRWRRRMEHVRVLIVICVTPAIIRPSGVFNDAGRYKQPRRSVANPKISPRRESSRMRGMTQRVP